MRADNAARDQRAPSVLRHTLYDADRRAPVAEMYVPSQDCDALLIDTGAGIGENVVFPNDVANLLRPVPAPEPTTLFDAHAMIHEDKR